MRKTHKRWCFLCKEKHAKLLLATNHAGNTYINAVKEPVFCTYRCAAIYALLYGPPHDGHHHWCTVSGEWEPCDNSDCEYCKQRNKENQ